MKIGDKCMKKIIFIILIVCGLCADEQQNKESYDITKDWIYNGCRDVLSDKWSNDRNYIFGLAVAKKDATLELLDIMSMRVVNGVDEKNVCKWYLDAVNDKEISKYVQSSNDSKRLFLNIVERSVIQDNGESYVKFEENLKKMIKLFKK